jgi:hypothetical protein
MFAEAAGASKTGPLVTLQAGQKQHCNSFSASCDAQGAKIVKKATLWGLLLHPSQF